MPGCSTGWRTPTRCCWARTSRGPSRHRPPGAGPLPAARRAGRRDPGHRGLITRPVPSGRPVRAADQLQRLQPPKANPWPLWPRLLRHSNLDREGEHPCPPSNSHPRRPPAGPPEPGMVIDTEAITTRAVLRIRQVATSASARRGHLDGDDIHPGLPLARRRSLPSAEVDQDREPGRALRERTDRGPVRPDDQSGSGDALLRPRPLRTVQAAVHRTRLKQAPGARGQAKVLDLSAWRLRSAADIGCGEDGFVDRPACFRPGTRRAAWRSPSG